MYDKNNKYVSDVNLLTKNRKEDWYLVYSNPHNGTYDMNGWIKFIRGSGKELSGFVLVTEDGNNVIFGKIKEKPLTVQEYLSIKSSAGQ